MLSYGRQGVPNQENLAVPEEALGETSSQGNAPQEPRERPICTLLRRSSTQRPALVCETQELPTNRRHGVSRGYRSTYGPPQRGCSLKTTAPSVTVSLPGDSGPAPPLRKGPRPSPVPPYCAFRAVPQTPGLTDERPGPTRPRSRCSPQAAMLCSSRPGNRACAGPAPRPAAHGTAKGRMRSEHEVPAPRPWSPGALPGAGGSWMSRLRIMFFICFLRKGKDNPKVNGLSGREPPGPKSGKRSINWGKRNFGSARSQPIGHLPKMNPIQLEKRTAPAD